MENNRRRRSKIRDFAHDSEEVSSIEWEDINMSEQEVDLIYRMHRLVGERNLFHHNDINGKKDRKGNILQLCKNKVPLFLLSFLGAHRAQIGIIRGDRWELIAGRIPGRKAEEIERFWIMRHNEAFAQHRRKLTRKST